MKPRLIARLDIKGTNLIKSINLEGIRVIGKPEAFALRYYEQGIDELIWMDMVASLYGRNNLHDIVRKTAHNVFVPLTVGGGIRSTEDARTLLQSGADKVAINTAAIQRPELIRELAETFGSQAVVLSIEAKKVGPDKWEPYTDTGRERSFRDAIEWAQEGVALGAGEILITSIDQEGTRQGFDCELTQRIASAVSIPVIASGGMGTVSDAVDVIKKGRADSVAIASVLHYDKLTLQEIREGLHQAGIAVRAL